MRSSPNPSFETWNRKLHYYLGLYFLFFLWLFAFTGLLLNHPQWPPAQFWSEREEAQFQVSIQPLPGDTDLARARELMRQLNLAGEIDWPDQAPPPGKLEFTVNRPGSLNRVSADLVLSNVSVQHIRINAWGVMNVLHSFSGTRANNPSANRDWLLTTLWVAAMDALAAGLLLMVLTSYYMWFRLRQKRRLGLIALASGVLICGFFLAGLSAF